MRPLCRRIPSDELRSSGGGKVPSLLIFRASLTEVAILATQQLALAFDFCQQAHRPSPQLRSISQSVAGLRAIEVHAFMDMAEQQLAPVLEVAVRHHDHRLAAVGQLLEQLILHLLELAAHDLPVAAALGEPERVELLLDAELEGEELVDERDVVVQLADLEQPPVVQAGAAIPVPLLLHRVALVPLFAELPAVPAVLDIAVQLDAEL